MKILIVTPFFPYSNVGHAGGKEIYEFVKALSQKHKIHLLSRIEPDQFVFIDEMKKFCTKIELFPFKTPEKRSILSILLIIWSYLRLGIKANRLMEKKMFDLAQVEYIETGLLIMRHAHLPMILDAHDVITKPAKRRYLSSKGLLKKALHFCISGLTKIIERHTTGKFDLIFTRSRMDMEILLKKYKGLSVSVIPHPVPDSILLSGYNRKSNTLLFVGDMRRDVNTEGALYFFEKVWPLVRKEIPNAKFYIVGNKPNQRVKAMLRIDKNVIVTGFVEKLEPYYLKASVFVSTLFIGGGIIAKNLEAMAFGLPVVTTSIGNEGIEAVPGRDILIADNPERFAEKVLLLLRDAQKYEEIAQNGRQFVLNNFGLKSIVNKIEDNYRALKKMN